MSIKKYVAGSLTIPVYYAVPTNVEDDYFLKNIAEKLNMDTVSVIHADICTWDGQSYPLNARRCLLEWFEIIREDELLYSSFLTKEHDN